MEEHYYAEPSQWPANSKPPSNLDQPMEIDLESTTIQAIQPVKVRLSTYSRQSSPSPLRLSPHSVEEQPQLHSRTCVSPPRTRRGYYGTLSYSPHKPGKRPSSPNLHRLNRSVPYPSPVKLKTTLLFARKDISEISNQQQFQSQNTVPSPLTLVNTQHDPKHFTRSRVKLLKQNYKSPCPIHGKLVPRMRTQTKAPKHQSTPKIPQSQRVEKMVSRAKEGKPKLSLSKLLTQSKSRTPTRGRFSHKPDGKSPMTRLKRQIMTDFSPDKSQTDKITRKKKEVKNAGNKKQHGIMTGLRNLTASIQQRFAKKGKRQQVDLDLTKSSKVENASDVQWVELNSEQKTVLFTGATEALNTPVKVSCFGTRKVNITKKPVKCDKKPVKKKYIAISSPRIPNQLIPVTAVTHTTTLTSLPQHSKACTSVSYSTDATTSAPVMKSTKTSITDLNAYQISFAADEMKSTQLLSPSSTASLPASEARSLTASDTTTLTAPIRKPPRASKTTLPVASKTTPPTALKITPPTAGETTPTAGETTPPTAGETTPPTAGETTPPTAGETKPPTDLKTAPTPKRTPPTTPNITPPTSPNITLPIGPKITLPTAPKITLLTAPKTTLPKQEEAVISNTWIPQKKAPEDPVTCTFQTLSPSPMLSFPNFTSQMSSAEKVTREASLQTAAIKCLKLPSSLSESPKPLMSATSVSSVEMLSPSVQHSLSSAETPSPSTRMSALAISSPTPQLCVDEPQSASITLQYTPEVPNVCTESQTKTSMLQISLAGELTKASQEEKLAAEPEKLPSPLLKDPTQDFSLPSSQSLNPATTVSSVKLLSPAKHSISSGKTPPTKMSWPSSVSYLYPTVTEPQAQHSIYLGNEPLSTKHPTVVKAGYNIGIQSHLQTSSLHPTVADAIKPVVCISQQQPNIPVNSEPEVSTYLGAQHVQSPSTPMIYSKSPSPAVMSYLKTNSTTEGTPPYGGMPSALSQRIYYTNSTEHVLSSMSQPSLIKPSCLYEGTSLFRPYSPIARQELSRPLSVLIPDSAPVCGMDNFNSSVLSYYKHQDIFHSSYLQYQTRDPVMTQTALSGISTWDSNLQYQTRDPVMTQTALSEIHVSRPNISTWDSNRQSNPVDLTCYETFDEREHLTQTTARRETMTQTTLSIPSETGLPELSLSDLVEGGINITSSVEKNTSFKEQNTNVKEWNVACTFDSSENQTSSTVCSHPSVSETKQSQQGKKTFLVLPSVHRCQSEAILGGDLHSIEKSMPTMKSRKRLFENSSMTDSTCLAVKKQKTESSEMSLLSSCIKLSTSQPARTQDFSDCSHIENILSDRPCNIVSGVCSEDFSNKSTKEIINEYYNTHIFKRSRGKPHIVSRDLVWRLFTVAELYGNRFNTLNAATTEAIHDNVMKMTQCDESMWRGTCIPYINRAIREFFRTQSKKSERLFQHRCDPSVC